MQRPGDSQLGKPAPRCAEATEGSSARGRGNLVLLLHVFAVGQCQVFFRAMRFDVLTLFLRGHRRSVKLGSGRRRLCVITAQKMGILPQIVGHDFSNASRSKPFAQLPVLVCLQFAAISREQQRRHIGYRFRSEARMSQ
jgi:hypothetical protein